MAQVKQISEIKVGDIFGIMEVTPINNGRIELRNKDSIDLAPGAVVNLMGEYQRPGWQFRCRPVIPSVQSEETMRSII